MNTSQLVITTNNRYQNIGEQAYSRPNTVGNLAVEHPTFEQMNAAIGATEVTAHRSEPDAFFGTHIREAVAIVKDWAKPR